MIRCNKWVIGAYAILQPADEVRIKEREKKKKKKKRKTEAKF